MIFMTDHLLRVRRIPGFFIRLYRGLRRLLQLLICMRPTPAYFLEPKRWKSFNNKLELNNCFSYRTSSKMASMLLLKVVDAVLSRSLEFM